MSLATVGTDTGGSIRIPARSLRHRRTEAGVGRDLRRGVVPLSRSSITSGRSRVGGRRGAALRRAARPPPRRIAAPRRSTLDGLRSAMLDGYFFDRLDAGRRARESMRRRRAAPRAHARETQSIPARRRHRADLSALWCSPMPRPITRARSSRRRRTTRRTSAAARDGPLRAGRGLRARAARPRVIAREGRRALDGVDALVCPALAIRSAADRRRHRAGRRAAGTGAHGDAALHAAVQPVGPSGHHPALRHDARRLPVGLQLVGHQGPHAAAAARRPRGRSSARRSQDDRAGSSIAGSSGSPRQPARARRPAVRVGTRLDAAINAAIRPRRLPRTPRIPMRAWVDEVMRDTDAFFTPAADRDYTFTPAGPGAPAAKRAR